MYPKFLTDEECDHVVKIGLARLAPSQLALKAGDTLESQKDVRTSSGTFLTRGSDPGGVLTRIEQRIAEVRNFFLFFCSQYSCRRKSLRRGQQPDLFPHVSSFSVFLFFSYS
jgi:hypothetical protein